MTTPQPSGAQTMFGDFAPATPTNSSTTSDTPRDNGGPAPVRRSLPELIEKIRTRQINPGRVFDLTVPLDKAAEGYAAMDARTAIKVLLQP